MDHKQERNLVDELALRNQVLFATYKKTEEVAINRWYPGISAKNGSTNSYPHVQGVIQQLSLVVYHPQCAVVLTDAELYLLLTSILLHDIGKVETNDDHGRTSQELIQSHWAELKIENEQMQHIIQTICLLHDRKVPEFEKVYQQLPVDEYIDRYGKVRPRLLGALLYLGDHMDNSYTRTMTEEFTKHFRRNVLGVHFQPEQQLITTVIDPGMFFSAQTEKQKLVQQAAKKDAGQSDTEKDKEAKGKVPLHPKCEKCLLTGVGALGKYLESDPNLQKTDAKVEAHLDADSICYLLGDTFDNDACLRNICNELYVLGMPIKKWMIECKGQLFLVLRDEEPGAKLVIDENDLKELLTALKATENSEAGCNLALKNKYYIEFNQLKKKAATCPTLNQMCETLKIDRNQPVQGQPAEQAGPADSDCSFSLTKADAASLKEAFLRMQKCPYSTSEKKQLNATFQSKYCTYPSIEPLTGYDYCEKVLAGMYEITSTIFAKSFFSYTDLSNYLREDPNNTRKVMSAVRRLSFLFQHMAQFGGKDKKPCYEIYYDDQVWNLKKTDGAAADAQSASSTSGEKPQEPQESTKSKIRFITPKPDEKPNVLLKIQREQGSIADWTKELK